MPLYRYPEIPLPATERPINADYMINRWIEVPDYISRLLCQCMRARTGGSVYRDGSQGDPGIDWSTHKCKGCGKYDYFWTATCITCGIHFVRDFKHPYFCSQHNPHCWQHIEDSPAICGPCPSLHDLDTRKPPISELHKNVVVEWSDSEAALFSS